MTDELILMGTITDCNYDIESRVYGGGGISPTIRATMPPLIEVENERKD